MGMFWDKMVDGSGLEQEMIRPDIYGKVPVLRWRFRKNRAGNLGHHLLSHPDRGTTSARLLTWRQFLSLKSGPNLAPDSPSRHPIGAQFGLRLIISPKKPYFGKRAN
jgi:hypothetical protein